jgi:hypothetical protein
MDPNRNSADDTFDIRETYPAQEHVAAAAGWDDPAMDDYNDDAHRKPNDG